MCFQWPTCHSERKNNGSRSVFCILMSRVSIITYLSLTFRSSGINVSYNIACFCSMSSRNAKNAKKRTMSSATLRPFRQPPTVTVRVREKRNRVPAGLESPGACGADPFDETVRETAARSFFCLLARSALAFFHIRSIVYVFFGIGRFVEHNTSQTESSLFQRMPGAI